MAKRITSDGSKEPATFAPGDDQSCSDARTAELLDISIKTLQRLDAKKIGPQFFMVGSRKRRTLGAIRKFQRGESGHWFHVSGCPLCAKCGLMHCSKDRLYSITSSVRGTAKPSVICLCVQTFWPP